MSALRSRGPSPLALGLLLLSACAQEGPPPRWIELAREHRPRALAEQVAEWEQGLSGTVVEADHLGVGLRRELAATDWTPTEAPGEYACALPGGAWRASAAQVRLVASASELPRGTEEGELELGAYRLEGTRLVLRLAPGTRQPPPLLARLRPAPGAAPLEQALRPGEWRVAPQAGTFFLELPPLVVRTGEEGPRLAAEIARAEAGRALAPFEYRIEGERLSLRLPPGEAPPRAYLAARLENGREVNGRWQLRLARYCGDGIPVWSGGREELVRDLPPDSALSFRFAHAAPGAVQARVLLDGELLWQRAFEPGAAQRWEHVVLALPARGRAGARLVFEVEGPPGLGAFFAPMLGPRAHGTPRARPWPARPDIVLFLADTFRADSLALYGGTGELAPAIEGFAARALRCAHARSTAAWTLPAIGSLLTGLYPGQHGATDEDLSLPFENETLAELLAEAGYRTGAITDGSFFGPVFGLDQGFQWFVERNQPEWDLDATVRDALRFLAEDDGRPVFLVVHTYRVHQPYRVGPDEDARAYEALLARVFAEAGTRSPDSLSGRRALLPHQDELRALYQAGVRDLDRGFGEFLGALDGRAYLEHGYLLLTSDHGEALGENQDFFHGQHLWEVKLRVPLLLAGPAVSPRTLPFTAGLIDVPPTLAQLARLSAPAAWSGTSLLTLAEERPSFAYQLSARSRQVAFLDGTRKVITTPTPEALGQGECEEAFELALDPGEARNLAPAADWPAELTRRLAPAIRVHIAGRSASQRAPVDAELRGQLDGLGYGGGALDED